MAAREHPTLQAFLALPEQEPALEYEAGVVTQKVAPKARHSRLQYTVAEWFNRFGEPRKLALAFPELRTTFAGASLVPDVAVYRWERLPIDASGELVDDVLTPPDVAVEIASPGQSRARLARRCRWYVEHGVSLGLLLDPEDRTVRVFRPGREPETLHEAHWIDCTDVVPGLEIPVQALFAALRVR